MTGPAPGPGRAPGAREPHRAAGPRRLDLLGSGFRPFFLAAGLFGTLETLLWLARYEGLLPPPRWQAASGWHAHEMLFGWAAAAVAGFLLTAAPVWTRTRPLSGVPLAALFGLWLAGRLGVALAGSLPPVMVALVDGAFLPILALRVARPILAARQLRNYGFPAALAGLAVANALVHLEVLGLARGAAAAGLRLGIGILALLVTIVAGRLTPSFTANALRRRGDPAPVRSRAWCERLAAPSVLAFVVADQLDPRSTASGLLALAAALVVLVRMTGWQSLRILGDPLLWSLHLGHLWLGLGLAAVGAADLWGGVAWTTVVHALTAGAFGATILAVMSRVPLGHTGRPFVAPRPMAWAYAAVSLGALVRVLGPLGWPELARASVLVGGLLWSAGLLCFVVVYAPILLAPRVDAAPG